MVNIILRIGGNNIGGNNIGGNNKDFDYDDDYENSDDSENMEDDVSTENEDIDVSSDESETENNEKSNEKSNEKNNEKSNNKNKKQCCHRILQESSNQEEIKNEAFLEYCNVFSNIYGTHRSQVDLIIQENKVNLIKEFISLIFSIIFFKLF